GLADVGHRHHQPDQAAQGRGATLSALAALVVALAGLFGRRGGPPGAPPAPPSTARPPVRPDPDRRNRDLEALYAVAVSIGSAGDLRAVAPQTVDLVCGRLRMDAGILYRL